MLLVWAHGRIGQSLGSMASATKDGSCGHVHRLSPESLSSLVSFKWIQEMIGALGKLISNSWFSISTRDTLLILFRKPEISKFYIFFNEVL